jgi:hypothetical protein
MSPIPPASVTGSPASVCRSSSSRWAGPESSYGSRSVNREAQRGDVYRSPRVRESEKGRRDNGMSHDYLIVVRRTSPGEPPGQVSRSTSMSLAASTSRLWPIALGRSTPGTLVGGRFRRSGRSVLRRMPNRLALTAADPDTRSRASSLLRPNRTAAEAEESRRSLNACSNPGGEWQAIRARLGRSSAASSTTPSASAIAGAPNAELRTAASPTNRTRQAPSLAIVCASSNARRVFPALAAAAEVGVAAVGLQPGDTRAGRHVDGLQHLARLRIDAPEVALLALPGAVPQLAVDPGDAGDDALGSRCCAGPRRSRDPPGGSCGPGSSPPTASPRPRRGPSRRRRRAPGWSPARGPSWDRPSECGPRRSGTGAFRRRRFPHAPRRRGSARPRRCRDRGRSACRRKRTTRAAVEGHAGHLVDPGKGPYSRMISAAEVFFMVPIARADVFPARNLVAGQRTGE